MRQSFEHLYMNLAKGLATRSKCKRLQVGCVITSSDFKHVYGCGYNGDAAKQNNKCSRTQGTCGDLHAELNAILNSNCSKQDKKYVFCTTLPCLMCSKALVNFGGVKRIYYSNEYRDKSSLKIFKKARIKVIHLNTEYSILNPINIFVSMIGCLMDNL